MMHDPLNTVYTRNSIISNVPKGFNEEEKLIFYLACFDMVVLYDLKVLGLTIDIDEYLERRASNMSNFKRAQFKLGFKAVVDDRDLEIFSKPPLLNANE